MITSKIERQLKNLSLNSYEVKLWVAVLGVGTSTAGELSEIANVPRSRCYGVLESLENKGFVVASPGKPVTYAATPPIEAIKHAKEKVQSQAKKEIVELTNLKIVELIKKLLGLYESGLRFVENHDLGGIFQGRDKIYEQMGLIMDEAKKSILISATQNEFLEIISRFSKLFESLNKKKVKIKIVVETNNENVKHYPHIGGFIDIKKSKNIARFCVVDGKEIVFMVLDEGEISPPYDVAIWVKTPLAAELEKIY